LENLNLAKREAKNTAAKKTAKTAATPKAGTNQIQDKSSVRKPRREHM
jgi:hypothetical protein